MTLSGVSGASVIADGVLISVGRRQRRRRRRLPRGARLAPVIDAGDPASPSMLEPAPNGGRVNQGYDGDTSAAQSSSVSLIPIAVLNPAPFGKYEVGEQVPIDIAGDDLGQSQPASLDGGGGGGFTPTATEGDWQASAFQTSGTIFSNTTSVAALSGIPNALFANGAAAANANPGTALNFTVPAPDGTYTLRLYFADPNSTAAGQDVFNIVVNGQTLAADYDVFKAAGGENKAVELDLTVTAGGNTGLEHRLRQRVGRQCRVRQRHRTRQRRAIGIALTHRQHRHLHRQRHQLGAHRQECADQSFRPGAVQLDSGSHLDGGPPDPRHIRIADRDIATIPARQCRNELLHQDESQTGDQYTTAIGNDANPGKSPTSHAGSRGAAVGAIPSRPVIRFMSIPEVIWRQRPCCPRPMAARSPTPRWSSAPPMGAPGDRARQYLGRDRRDRRNRRQRYHDREFWCLPVPIMASICVAWFERCHAGWRHDLRQRRRGIFTPINGAINNLGIVDSTIYNNAGPGITLQGGVLNATLSNDVVYSNTGDGIDAFTGPSSSAAAPSMTTHWPESRHGDRDGDGRAGAPQRAGRDRRSFKAGR